MSDKVVLAYAGGLETSVCVHWLRYKRNLKVVTFSAELGGGEYLEPVAEQAIDAGAASAHVGDLRQRFLAEHVLPALRAGARYERGYYLSTALSRPLIASELVRIAREEGCRYVAHGASLLGNDRVRFEASVAALAPELQVITPQSEWGLRDRAALLAYAGRHAITAPSEPDRGYTVDCNLWGAALAKGPLADPWEEVPPAVWVMTADPRSAPDEPATVTVAFEAGAPVGLDGRPAEALEIVTVLNRLGGAHGVGRADCVENRLSGQKSREIYEAPAAAILTAAHEGVEDLTLPKDVLHFKEGPSKKYAQLVYDGQWFSDLRAALDDFFARIQARVTGEARVRLHKGSAVVVGRRSGRSLLERRKPETKRSVRPA